MATPSASEGEVSDSYSEKATTTLSTAKRTSVNARLREALSTSPEPLASADMGRSRRRDRSRSPRRSDYNHVRRGEKRARDDGFQDTRARNDARRSRAHLEGDRPRHGMDGRPALHRTLDHDARHERDLPSRKRQRTRSRSPGYDGRRGPSNYKSAQAQASPRGGDFRGSRGNEHNSSRGDSVRERDGAFRQPRQTADSRAEDRASSKQQGEDTAGGLKRQRFADHDSTGRRIPPPDEHELEPAPVVDEHEAIEERRRRREAIKAKHSKDSATPLLVRALESANALASPARPGDATPTSPGFLSPAASAPGTPVRDSDGASPPSLIVNNDLELAKETSAAPSTPGDDEHSAADYNPAMDMQEDRLRKGVRDNVTDVPASAYDETRGEKKDILLPNSQVVQLEGDTIKASGSSADDMFASDDEDDMFAPVASSAKGGPNGGPGKADPIPKAKELDVNLLDNWDDPEGYYKIILGELLDGRYHIQANLGKGMFSSVVRAMDTTDDTLKAIKVIRNNETMTKAAAKEMDILERLADADPDDKKHMIRLERSFVHKGHLCMVFEHLSINLREVLKKFGRDVGINLKAVRSYAQQMFLGLTLMKKCNILHADLKPDNILVNEARNVLKICDLGSAADAGENDITPYLVSRFYRAPEIILGIPYDFAIDMWSIGCTLFELYTGKILFTGRTNNQMLRAIMECRGKFSLKMLKKAEFGAVHFDDHNLNFRSMERDKITGKDMTRLMNFVKPTRDLKSRLLATAGSAGGKLLPEADLKELTLFADLLDRCLALNPERRLSPLEALKHPFIYREPLHGGLMPPSRR